MLCLWLISYFKEQNTITEQNTIQMMEEQIIIIIIKIYLYLSLFEPVK